MEHILNENELNEAYAEIKSIDEKINGLDKRRCEICHMLVQNAINKAKNRFPGIEFGDKVKVVRRTHELHNPDATETVTRYMGSYFHARYGYSDYYNCYDYIKLELYQEKMDGTRSFRKDETYANSIISIEKVEE